MTREFIESELAPHADRFDADGALPRPLLGRLAELGLLGAALPEQRGGGGWDAPAWGRLHADVGRACGATRSLLTVTTLVGLTLERWAQEPARDRFVPAIARGQLLAAVALSEPAAGSDLSAMEAQAHPCEGGYLLRGVKRWVSFGQMANLFLIYARVDGSIAGFLVEGGAAGLVRTPIAGLLGLRATQLADLELRDCFVPAEHRVGRGDLPFGPVVETALDVGRYSVAWGAVGIAEACLDASLAHTRSRRQFGKPLADHQLVAQKLADMMTSARAARLLCHDAGVLRQAGAPGARAAAMMAKYFATTAASRIAADAVQLHGAAGCLAGSGVERHFRDARLLEIIEGSTQMQQIMIASDGSLTGDGGRP